MSAQPQSRLTPEEYLELDRASDIRHEYYNGHMYAMAGGSYRHARIIHNLGRALGNVLDGTPCEVTENEVRVQTLGALYVYPDIVVVCGEPKFIDGQADTLLNPTVLIEVLSPSTEAYDRGFKSAQYRTLDAVQEYALVSQTEARVEVFRRQPGGHWLLSEFVGLDTEAHFDSVNARIQLKEVYSKIVFDAPA
jgi:Uma2 family endonuclease